MGMVLLPGLLTLLTTTLATPNGDALAQRFADPPRDAGAAPLLYFNGTMTKETLRAELLELRDKGGFGGVTPIAENKMQPPTSPKYLSPEYCELYGYLLDTCRELGMRVVFYDDCDFPSGTAGGQMLAKYPDLCRKYLARSTAKVAGPGPVNLTSPKGIVACVRARNEATGEQRWITHDVHWVERSAPCQGGSVGFREPEEETARFANAKVTGADGKTIFADSLTSASVDKGWKGGGNLKPSTDGLSVNNVQPLVHAGISLPAAFTYEADVTVVDGAAGLVFGEQRHQYFMWQFRADGVRPHFYDGGKWSVFGEVHHPLEVGRKYHIALKVDGSTVTTLIDGEKVTETALPQSSQCNLEWQAPAGDWSLESYVIAPQPGNDQVDMLDHNAMAKFIDLTYGEFYRRFPEHWGTTIKLTFFDDISCMQTPNSLMWTPTFDKAFEARYHCSPEKLYPALFGDIGPETGAARIALYNVRNELFANGYPGDTGRWCAKRGVVSSGHPAGAYNATPLDSPGDALLFYKYQGVPLTDYIHFYHHGIDGITIPASAAYNWDKDRLVIEIFGNFMQKQPNDGKMLYRASMEVYARGGNQLLPHAAWWDPSKLSIVPDVSPKNPAYAAELPRYNRWIARCETLLRGGRHVADIGVVYPIYDLEARCNWTQHNPNWGYDPLPGTDYHEICRLLTSDLRHDYTLLHPEVIDQKCRVEGRELVLDNKVNRERYQVLIVPACETISVSNLQRVKEFYDAGGAVVATTCLPAKSAEFGRDAEVKKLADAMWGPGGHAQFVPKPDRTTLGAALDSFGLTWDVRLDGVADLPEPDVRNNWDFIDGLWRNQRLDLGGNRQFAYIHKVLDGRDVYYLANSSEQTVTSQVTLRGHHQLQAWDPLTGERKPVETELVGSGAGALTRANLSLPPITSVFWVDSAK